MMMQCVSIFTRCCLVVLFFVTSASQGFAQERLLYFFSTTDTANLSVVQKIKQEDHTLSVATLSRDFSEFLDTQTLYKFERAFPQAKTKAVRHVFLVALQDTSQVAAFLARPEIE